MWWVLALFTYEKKEGCFSCSSRRQININILLDIWLFKRVACWVSAPQLLQNKVLKVWKTTARREYKGCAGHMGTDNGEEVNRIHCYRWNNSVEIWDWAVWLEQLQQKQLYTHGETETWPGSGESCTGRGSSENMRYCFLRSPPQPHQLLECELTWYLANSCSEEQYRSIVPPLCCTLKGSGFKLQQQNSSRVTSLLTVFNGNKEGLFSTSREPVVGQKTGGSSSEK